MGRGGGGSSGGRSFSSGGGRSFGGRSSSSHRGGSSSSHRGGGSSSFRSGSSSYRPRTTHHYHHYGGGYGMPRVSTGGIGICIIGAAMAIIFLVFVGILLSGDNLKINGARMSTIERTAIQPEGPFDKDCIDDRAGWITDRNTLLRGMEQFYKLTGVQPAICITEDIDGDVEAFASARYDELVGHEKGVLLLFHEWAPSDWSSYYMAGKAAQTVMDTEACDILLDFVEAYYTSDMSEDEYFGAVFRETGERIMTVTPTVASKIPWIVCGAVVIALAVAAVSALRLKHKRDKERAAETERILNTPIDRL